MEAKRKYEMERLRSALLKSGLDSRQGQHVDNEEEAAPKAKEFSVSIDAGVDDRPKAFDPKMIEEKLMSEAILREIRLAILNDEVFDGGVNEYF